MEILEFLKDKQEEEKYQKQWEASLAYKQAGLISTIIAGAFSGNGRLPQIHEIFPSLFEEQRMADWRTVKEEMKIYKNKINARKGR